MTVNISEKDGAVTLEVRVVPRASRSEIVGEHEGALKIRIASPPVDGAANAELIRLLAKKLGVPRRNISIISGENSKNKRIMIANLSQSELEGLIR